MTFDLTEEQINEIKEKYTDSLEVINDIKDDLNELGIVDDPDDFFELICSTAVSFESMKLETTRRIEEHNRLYDTEMVIGDLDRFVEEIMPIKSILLREIKIKYNGEESRLFNNRKLKSL